MLLAHSFSCFQAYHLLLQDKEMVKLLLEMKAGLDTVMEEAFAKDERFGHALKDAFEHFVNQRANRCDSFAHPSTCTLCIGKGHRSEHAQLSTRFAQVHASRAGGRLEGQ